MNDLHCSGYRKAGWCVFAACFVLLFFCANDLFAQSFGTGTFQGILQSDSDNDESFGFITLTLTSSGSFSMRFNMGVNKVGYHYYAKTGKFDSSGHYHFEGPDPNDTRFAVARVIDLQLDSVDAPTKITGTMTDLTHSSNVSMERVDPSSPGNPSPWRGAYTFLFSSGDSGVPNNTGYGRAVVSAYGHVIASGRSADGRPFTTGANITIFNRWPVFAKMAGVTNGILSGWISFQNTSSSDFTGQLVWLGPEVPGPNHAFVPAFSGNVNVTGSSYVHPAGATVLDVNSSSNNVHLSLTDGGLENSIDRDLTLTGNNRFVFSPRLAGDSLVVNPATGLFNGTFKHSDGRIYMFHGAILQKQNMGGGEFIDREREGGDVSLTAKSSASFLPTP